jgi:uncharacterized protein YdaU (DUF1376 family)
MHYFQFNIKDYQSHTGHLDDLEDLAYRRLLDWCYLHERPLPSDPAEVARLIRMRSHTDCIAAVLREFFVSTEGGWISERVQRELQAVSRKSEKARESAKARWNKGLDANASETHTEGYATHNPLPITHNPDLVVPNGTTRPADAEPAVSKKVFSGCNHQAVIDLYHQTLPTLNRIEVWNEVRQGLLRSRWREVAAEMVKEGKTADEAALLDWWKTLFVYVGKSKFLTGRAEGSKDRPFKADLEWIIRPTNFAKIIEGKYHGG